MVARYVLALCVTLVACAANSSPPHASKIEWTLPKGESLAYRFNAEVKPVVDGTPKAARTTSGFVFIDVDEVGNATVQIEAGLVMLGQPDLDIRPGKSSFLFPLPQSPIGTRPVAQLLTVKGLGTTATRSNPDLEITETFRRMREDAGSVQLAFARRGRSSTSALVGVEFEEKGEGAFSVASGRYESLRRTTKMIVRSDDGIRQGHMVVWVTSKMEFDAARSRSRSRARSGANHMPANVTDVSSYVGRHPAKREIADALSKFENGHASAVLLFHLKANPVTTWEHGISLPKAKAEAFAATASFFVGRAGPLRDALVNWMLKELPNKPALAAAVVNLRDERFRSELVGIASEPGGASSPDSARRAKRARVTLAALDAVKSGPAALLAADAKTFVRVGHALLADERDPRRLVPALIKLLDRSSANPSPASLGEVDTRQVAVQWLEGITSRSFGNDAQAWQKFWVEHRSKPHCQWSAEAVRRDNQLLANNALSRLSRCRNVAGMSAVLANSLGRGSRLSRRIAALSLAEHADVRAIPGLLDLLSGADVALRGQALIALANFRNTTLGYNPSADDAVRRAAIGRWKRWAQSVPKTSD